MLAKRLAGRDGQKRPEVVRTAATRQRMPKGNGQRTLTASENLNFLCMIQKTTDYAGLSRFYPTPWNGKDVTRDVRVFELPDGFRLIGCSQAGAGEHFIPPLLPHRKPLHRKRSGRNGEMHCRRRPFTSRG